MTLQQAIDHFERTMDELCAEMDAIHRSGRLLTPEEEMVHVTRICDSLVFLYRVPDSAEKTALIKTLRAAIEQAQRRKPT